MSIHSSRGSELARLPRNRVFGLYGAQKLPMNRSKRFCRLASPGFYAGTKQSSCTRRNVGTAHFWSLTFLSNVVAYACRHSPAEHRHMPSLEIPRPATRVSPTSVFRRPKTGCAQAAIATMRRTAGAGIGGSLAQTAETPAMTRPPGPAGEFMAVRKGRKPLSVPGRRERIPGLDGPHLRLRRHSGSWRHRQGRFCEAPSAKQHGGWGGSHTRRLSH
jgi:hypothetical protein